ncbi:uncharacterized protein LOC111379192 [Olea europaea var. sylvestris]|uniref:uncharacterized protein LOC111379192 n=1 Tax=Olea europaea var. sylvestris TaxID=158386 RepID=UPI000C1CD88C|nr:uncharacterized protein LOC111379192 [Olea europaea var. sylvestris]
MVFELDNHVRTKLTHDFPSSSASTENDRYIEGGSVSDNMLAEITGHGVDDDILEGVDVKSSNIVGDDGLANQMVGVENEIIVPTVGMKFVDETEVFEFYKRYAYQVGFPVRK